MPFCNCTSHGCGKQPNGTEHDRRTIERHQLVDYRLLASVAQKEEFEKTDQAIVSFVASMSLADKASGPATKSGSRLWSLASPTRADIDLMEAHISEHRPSKLPDSPPSKRQRISEFLGRLKAVERRLNDLKSSTSSQLAMGSPNPCRVGEPFPLEHELQLAKDLESDLLSIKSNFSEVAATKRFLVEQLDDLLQALKATKQRWIEASMQSNQQPSAPPYPHSGPPEYKSGQWSNTGPLCFSNAYDFFQNTITTPFSKG